MSQPRWAFYSLISLLICPKQTNGDRDMNKVLFTLCCFLAADAAIADATLSQKFSQTKEAICYNHPNKNICIDGINALMKGVKAASDTHYACLEVQKLGDPKSDKCNDVDKALADLSG